MAIVTELEVLKYAPNITASAYTIIANGYIPVVQERIQFITNNYFNSDDLCVQANVVFNTTARSITLDSEHWADYGFQAGDDILIYRSYRNDGVYTIDSLSDETLVVTSAYSVVDERFVNSSDGPVVYFSVIQWPVSIKQIAAQMIYYDHDMRDKVSYNLRSRSLGPLSESFSGPTDDEYGYPIKIISKLDPFRLVRLN